MRGDAWPTSGGRGEAREGFLEEEASAWNEQDSVWGRCQRIKAATNEGLGLKEHSLCLCPPVPLLRKQVPKIQSSALSLNVTSLERHSLASLYSLFCLHQPIYSLQGIVTTCNGYHLLTYCLSSTPEVSSLRAGTLPLLHSYTYSTEHSVWHIVHDKNERRSD